MRGSKTKGYECYDSLTPALSRRERGRSGLFQQPAGRLSKREPYTVSILHLIPRSLLILRFLHPRLLPWGAGIVHL